MNKYHIVIGESKYNCMYPVTAWAGMSFDDRNRKNVSRVELIIQT